MRYVLLPLFIIAATLCTAQGPHVIGGGGYSSRFGDESARMTYAWQLGVGYRNTLCARWNWEADVTFARSSYKLETAVKNEFVTQSTNGVTALGMAQWNTSDDAHSPFIGVGLFGTALVEEVPNFRSWDVGPALGVGLQWEGGRLMLHYQHSVTQLDNVQNAAGYVTLAISL